METVVVDDSFPRLEKDAVRKIRLVLSSAGNVSEDICFLQPQKGRFVWAT